MATEPGLQNGRIVKKWVSWRGAAPQMAAARGPGGAPPSGVDRRPRPGAGTPDDRSSAAERRQLTVMCRLGRRRRHGRGELPGGDRAGQQHGSQAAGAPRVIRGPTWLKPGGPRWRAEGGGAGPARAGGTGVASRRPWGRRPRCIAWGGQAMPRGATRGDEWHRLRGWRTLGGRGESRPRRVGYWEGTLGNVVISQD
jgi:hypothetical protein